MSFITKQELLIVVYIPHARTIMLSHLCLVRRCVSTVFLQMSYLGTSHISELIHEQGRRTSCHNTHTTLNLILTWRTHSFYTQYWQDMVAIQIDENLLEPELLPRTLAIKEEQRCGYRRTANHTCPRNLNQKTEKADGSNKGFMFADLKSDALESLLQPW